MPNPPKRPKRPSSLNDYAAIREQSEKMTPYFSPEFKDSINKIGGEGAVVEHGRISREDIEAIDGYLRGDSDTMPSGLSSSSLPVIQQARRAFAQNKRLREVSVGEIKSDLIPDGEINGEKFTNPGKGSTGMVIYNMKEDAPEKVERINSDSDYIQPQLKVPDPVKEETPAASVGVKRKSLKPPKGGKNKVGGYDYKGNRSAKGSLGRGLGRRN